MSAVKFWKFVSSDGYSLNGGRGASNSIYYSPGKVIEVSNANPDTTIQCSSGIHCIAYTRDKINDENILYGPKIAILEADPKDIIFQDMTGKCRLKRCKVIDLIDVVDAEPWMITGNGSYNFYSSVINNFSADEKMHDEKMIDEVCKNLFIALRHASVFGVTFTKEQQKLLKEKFGKDPAPLNKFTDKYCCGDIFNEKTSEFENKCIEKVGG